MHAISFIQDLAVIMLVAGVVTILFHRFKQPVVLGYIVVGFIIGPHTPPFGLIHDEETIKTLLDRELLNTISFHDAHESFYHGFLLALLNTCADWQVTSNAETGKGRSDILVERKDRTLGFVVEVKDVKDASKLPTACDIALRQIQDKDYTATLRRYRVPTIRTYGIAFHDKECQIKAGKASPQ